MWQKTVIVIYKKIWGRIFETEYFLNFLLEDSTYLCRMYIGTIEENIVDLQEQIEFFLTIFFFFFRLL